MRKTLLSIILLGAAATAAAQWGGPPGGPGLGVPPALALATVPGLSADQQAGVRKILLQHRDTMEQLGTKEHAEMEALHQRARTERERADDSTDAALRKLLGDDGYRKFAEWRLAQHGPHDGGPRGPGFGPGPGGSGMPGGPHGHGGPGPAGGAAPGPAPGGTPVAAVDDND